MAQENKTREQRRTENLTGTLPRGIVLGQWSDSRPKPFFVRYGSDRRLASFASESERNDLAQRLAEEINTNGPSVLSVELAELHELRDLRRECPVPISEIIQAWRSHSARSSMTVNEACEKYLSMRSKEEPAASDAHRHVKLHMKRLCVRFGFMRLSEVNADSVREFMRSLRDKSGRPMEEVTQRDHRKNWRAFFGRCVLEGWLDRNPCDLIQPPPLPERDRDLLSPREVFDLLKANRDQPVIGRMVFELFGGLRSSSAARLSPEHIRRDVKGIRLPGALHKSGKTKYRQGQPEALWMWFDHIGEAMFTEVTAKNYDERKRDAFVRSGVINPGNVLRNSFATYMLASTRNPPLVAYLMQHSSLKMLEHYEGAGEQADAELVLAMTPEAVAGSWENFVRNHHENTNPPFVRT